MESILFLSAKEIAMRIRSGRLTSYEVASQYLNQISLHNGQINAISDLRDPNSILAEAKEKDQLIQEGKIMGPLHGLPMTVKDTFHVKELITSNGNPKLKNNRVEEDAELVKRLKNAGAIIIGKTNLALYALDWQTSNSWFGQTNNPYDLARVVGGSSGGSAAALAAGFTPLELGTDAGGSIRVPAHFCGVCGLRTTESALSMRGNMESPGTIKTGRYLTANGPFARNIEDLMLITEILWNGTQTFSENPPVPFKQRTLAEGHPLRIAYSSVLGSVPLEKEYKVIYDQFIQKLKNNEISIFEDKPAYDEKELSILWGRIAGFDLAAALKRLPFKKVLAYQFIKQKYKDKIWAKGMAAGVASSAHEYIKSLLEKDKVGDQFAVFFGKYDAWITPVSAAPAFKHQQAGKAFDHNGTKLPYTAAFIPYNFPSTIPGHPIVVIPIGKTASGLPVGIQIHGKKWEDYRLLQIAKRLEGLTEGFSIPDVFV